MQLQAMPNTLDETYDQTIDQVPQTHRSGVLTILDWLAFAKEELFLEQLCEVVAFVVNRSGTLEFRSVEKWNSDVVERFCANLITITDVEISTRDSIIGNSYRDFLPGSSFVRIVKLAHFSVKEYLMTPSSPLNFASVNSHQIIAESCVAYILQFNHPDSLTQGSIHQFPLAVYAARY